jgi:asparagine synthase (glutamine-hydrolysing)
MADSLIHRGPDDMGFWVDADDGVALAHRRLSIVDLSPAGHQPMISANGRYVIIFNGEIYNHLELRRELEILHSNANLSHEAVEGLDMIALNLQEGENEFNISHPSELLGDAYANEAKSSNKAEFTFRSKRCKSINWRGNSDTETLLAGFEVWGIEETLKKTVGMFAIALWDQQEKFLTLARDRIGEKPLYYGFQNKTFLFGSELKALRKHPDFLSEIDRDVLCLYLRHCYIPAPYSIYKGIKKLLPGTYIQVRLGDNNIAQMPTPKVYWSMMDVALHAVRSSFEGSDIEAINALDSQLKQSIGLQMTADVPLGAFLSGGVDSSVVVALMQAQSMRAVKTFSIGFDEAGYNEAEYAKAVAQHLGSEHTEVYVTATEAMAVIPSLGEMYDEPFADSSQIPTFLVSQLAKQHVTVSLSGDAGDELFCGYNRYLLADTWQKIERLPLGVRKCAGHLIRTISPGTWDAIFQQAGKIKTFPSNMGEKLDKLANRLEKVGCVDELYYSLVSEIDCPEELVIGATEPKTWLTQVEIQSAIPDAKQRMMLMDAMTYLPDDILVKVDRAAMANSLEARVPFLDHRVVEFAWRLPMSMKIRERTSKWILRQVLYQYVPKSLIERPKAGFAVPLGEWLRGPLRGWVEDLIDENRLYREGYFNVQFVRELWHAHLTGRRNNQSLLWSLLMFQTWLAASQ